MGILRRLTAVTIGTAAALTFTACAPHAVTNGTGDSTPQAVNTDAASLGTVTLKFLDYSGGNDEQYMLQAIAAFEKKYPNIKIDRTSADFDQVMATLNLRLSDPNGPDIATINNGWQTMGSLAKAGLLLNLDPYAEAYGWRDQMSPTMQEQLEFTTDGKTMGKGALWGTPGPRLTTMGLYYNVDKLKALGIDPPTDVASLEKALAAAKTAGQIPIEAGMQEKTFATAPLYVLQTFVGDPQKISQFVYGNGGTMADTGMKEAAQLLQDWAKKGWFNPDASGVDFETGRNAFQKGSGVFHFDYSGAMAEEGVDGSKFARLAMPQENGEATLAVAGASAPLGIAARSEHKDAAAAFLNYMGSVEANQLAITDGMLPIRYDGITIPSGITNVFRSELDQTKTVTAHDGLLPFFDWASPNMLDIVGGQAQLIFAGKSTPQQLIDAGQADYDKFFASKK